MKSNNYVKIASLKSEPTCLPISRIPGSRIFDIKGFDEDLSKLPTLYWLPILHKRPYKLRFIVNSSSCTTTELSIRLTSCLTAINNHVINNSL